MGNVRYDPRFGRGMRKLMEREELTGRMLAEFAGLHETSVSEIKCLTAMPTLTTKMKIAAVFRMKVREVEALGEEAEADQSPR